MTNYGWRILVVDDWLGASVKPMMAELGEIDVAEGRAALASLVARRRTWDLALVDLLWQSPRAEANFDGLDAIAMLSQSEICPRAVLFTESGPTYRHWIEEASRFAIVRGSICKMPVDLVKTVRTHLLSPGEHWDPVMPVPRPRVVVDLLGTAKKPTTKGRLVLATLSGSKSKSYKQLAASIHVSEPTIKRQVSEMVNGLIEIGEISRESLSEKPQPVLWQWIGKNEAYLSSWARR